MMVLQRIARQPLERFLAGLAGVVSLGVSLWLWRLLYSDGMRASPLAGLYVLEMLLLSLTAAAAILRPGLITGWLWERWGWVAAGAMTAFAVLGLWSIGPAFAPGALLLLIAALAADRRRGRGRWAGFGLYFVAAVAQAVGMLALVATR